jgi:hypothetical protein
MKRANEETITEFKSMTVTIPDPMKRAKAIKDIERFGKGTGFKIDVMGDKFKVDGKGADLNKFATDLKNFYGATVKAESLEEATPVPPRDLMLTYGKPGEKVKAYYTKFMQDLQNKASELRKKGFVVDKMGRTQPMSKLRDTIPEELEEKMKLKYDKDKEGFYDEKGRRRYLSIGATNAIMRKKLDHAMKTGDWTDFNKEEVSYEETV